MKRTVLLLTLIVTTVVCNIGFAVTVTYGTLPGQGARDSGGMYLAEGSLVELRWAGADDAIGGGDDLVVDTTSIGFGFKTNGEWWKLGVNVDQPAGEFLYIRAYNAPTAGGATEIIEDGYLHAIPSQSPPTPMSIYYGIPEPSLFVLAMASLTLLTRRKS